MKLSSYIKNFKVAKPDIQDLQQFTRNFTCKEEFKMNPKISEIALNSSNAVLDKRIKSDFYPIKESLDSAKDLGKVTQQLYNTPPMESDFEGEESELTEEEKVIYYEEEENINESDNKDTEPRINISNVVSKNKIINNSHFTASNSTARMNTFDESEVISDDNRDHNETLGSEFLNYTSSDEPIPEVLTEEIESSDFSLNSPKETLPPKQAKEEKVVNNEISIEKFQELSNFLNQNYPKENDPQAEELIKQSNSLLSEVNHFIIETLPRKHDDLQNIKTNILDCWEESFQNITKKFTESTERIMELIVTLQNNHNMLFHENNQLRTQAENK